MLGTLIIAVIVVIASAGNLQERNYYEEKFYNWLSQFSMNPPTGWHFVRWLENFASNDDHIETHNAKKVSYTLGHNHFSHMSFDEWRVAMHLGPDSMFNTNRTRFDRAIHPTPSDGEASLPKAVDWSQKGGVTPVKNQGMCGSCWSFSTTGALEGAYYAKFGKLVSFSEQNLVDCDNMRHGGTDMGCNGGLMDHAFEYVEKNGGLCTEDDYPYVSGNTSHQHLLCLQKTCRLVAAVAPRNYSDVQVHCDVFMWIVFEYSVALHHPRQRTTQGKRLFACFVYSSLSFDVHLPTAIYPSATSFPPPTSFPSIPPILR